MTFTRDINDILEEIRLDVIRRNPKINYWGSMSVVRTISEAFAMQIRKMEQDLDNLSERLYIDTATGEDLDKLIVDRLPAGRLPGTTASGTVIFSRVDPAPYDITIPAGTIVAAVQNNEVLRYQVTEDAVIHSDETSTAANIVAEDVGSKYNVTAYAITSIITPVMGVSSVTNNLPITGGTDEESDDELRKRYIYTIEIPGKATMGMLEAHLNDLESVLETRCYTVAPGEVELIIDSADGFSYDPSIPETIIDNIALGVVARGALAATVGPDTQVYDIENSAGGYIWARAEEFIRYATTITVTYVDTLGDTKYTTISIPANTPRGTAIKSSMSGDTLAKRIIGSSVPSYNFSLLIGLYEYPYMFNLPETVPVTVNLYITPDDTAEEGLIDNIKESIEAFLNSFRIGESLELSDLLEYVYTDYETGRKFIGIDKINDILVSGNNQTLESFSSEISIDNDQRIRAGVVNVLTEPFR